MKLFKKLEFLVILLVLFSACTSTNKEVFIKNKEALREPIKVAVLPLTDAAGKDGSGTIISEMLTNELLKISNWTLVERSQLGKVMGEKELDMTGMTANDATQIGRLLKVDYIIVGSTATFEYKRQLGIVPTTKLNFNLRLLNVSSGEIVGTINYNRETNKYWAIGCIPPFTFYYAPYLIVYSLTIDKNINNDVKKAAKDIVKQINKDIKIKNTNSGCCLN